MALTKSYFDFKCRSREYDSTTKATMQTSPKLRMNRLFAADGKCFDVAIDHGFFNELSFLSGIEDIRKAVATIVQAAPDAVQLPPGTAPILQSI
ncbi:MAG: hypothetical protein LW628_09465, partial [Fimbriimonadaceae bacterium]|nr:hypothetical protein [Fimbriimonadaceae bacterium]